MKKTIITAAMAIALSALTIKANAQKGFNLSIKTAPQFSAILNEDDDNSPVDRLTTLNLSYGVGAGYNFNDHIGIATDVLYSMQGQKYKFGGNEYNQKVSYIKVPLMFTFNSNPHRPVSFIGKVGPQINILTTSKLTDNNGKDIVDDTNDGFQKGTIGGMFSAGMQLRLNKDLFFTMAFRGDIDFNDKDKNRSVQAPLKSEKIHNMTAGLELGLKFCL